MLLPLLNLILAVFRSAELGFFGFTVATLRQTPFICGLLASAGETDFRARWPVRQPRRTWFRVAGRVEVVENETCCCCCWRVVGASWSFEKEWARDFGVDGEEAIEGREVRLRRVRERRQRRGETMMAGGMRGVWWRVIDGCAEVGDGGSCL
jgi:hypothetical protein